MKRKTILFIFAAWSMGCSSPQRRESKLDIPVETIDFASFERIDGAFPEHLVKEKKYILLDDSEDFLFQTVSGFKMKNDRIYILDFRQKKLIVFNRDGKGIGTVGSAGQGPEEYLRIHDFEINDAGDIYLIDGTSDKLFVYDNNRKFVSAQKLPFEADIISCLQNNKLMFELSSWNEGRNKNEMIVVTDAGLETEESYMQYDEYIDNSFRISKDIFVDEGENILYNRSNDNFVYQFSKTGKPVKAYWFDFGKKNVPDEYKKDVEGNMGKYENYCCLRDFIFVNDKYALGMLWENTRTKSFVIDRKNRKLYVNNDNIIAYYNNSVVSYIYPGKYDDIRMADFPDDVKKHVENENFVLCISELY
jgi:hypothetical protein